MAEYAVNLNNGTTDEKGAFRLLGKLLNQSGVIEATALTVSATTPTPDLTVKVSGSVASDNAVFITTTGDTYHGWNTTNPYSVTITTNSTGVTKFDAIVAYIDTTAGSTTANNPGGLKFLAVRGSSTDGVTKATSTDIAATAVGTKPYIRLADVTVANGVSSINSGNIVDTRPKATVGAGLVTTTALAPNAATKFLGDLSWDTNNNVPRVIGGGGSGQWPGTTGATITTSGSDLLVFGQFQGLSLANGTCYVGFTIDGTGYEFASQSNNNSTVFSMCGMRTLGGIAAGTHSILPYGRTTSGSFTWVTYNMFSLSFIELRR